MKATTPRGIPYLEDTDPMNQVPGVIQALAEKAEKIIIEWAKEITP